ncbi:hypothetical protein [Leptolyngbya iicbica]|nr:hypothetical protein [Leptolyngbya sp. LK]
MGRAIALQARHFQRERMAEQPQSSDRPPITLDRLIRRDRANAW